MKAKTASIALAGGRVPRISVLLLLLMWHGTLAAAPPTDFPLRRSPAERIDPAAIDRIEGLWANRTQSPAETIRQASDEIGRYTSQFREKRHNDRRSLPVPERMADLNADLVRLIRVAQERESGAGFFFERSPYLKRLYTVMGQAYEAQDEPVRALGAFMTALRYGSFERPYDDPERAREADRPRLRSEVYAAIRSGLADPERASQENDAAIRAGAEPFRKTLDRFRQLEIEVPEARRQVYVEETKQLRGSGDVAGARSRLQSLEAELNQTASALEEFRKGTYRTYYERESRADGELLVRMAVLSREIETRLRHQERVLNRSNFYRGTGNVLGEERTVLRDFIGYRSLLEFAHRLHPGNVRAVSLLAEEYRTGRETTRAIMYYERWIELLQGKDEPGLALVYLRLAGLYADRRNFIRAVQVYEDLFGRSSPVLWQGVNEKMKEAPPEPGLAEVLPLEELFRLHLADLQFERTGGLDRARSGYGRALDALQRSMTTLPPAADYRLRSLLRQRSYDVMRRLAALERRSRRTDLEIAWLDRSVALFRELQVEGESARRDINETTLRLADLSAALRKKEDEATAREFYRLNYAVRPEQEVKRDYYANLLRVMDLPAVLERQAFLRVRGRDFEGARPLYREIIALGRGDQATRARANLDLLGLGPSALGRLALPPDFER